jgi:hypothetical protein
MTKFSFLFPTASKKMSFKVTFGYSIKNKIEIIFDNYFNIKESELIKTKGIYIRSVFLIYYFKNIEIHSKKYNYFYVFILVF